MKTLRNFLINLSLLILTPALFLGGAEWITRATYIHRLNTYFDDQAEQVLGKPAAEKQPGEYRIFIFGSSAAYGFPVADRYSIAAWLRKSFPHLTPERKVTVLNTAWPGKSSHQMARGARAVLKYKPDLFIIYSGNNEAVIDNRLFVDKPIYRLHLIMEYESAFYRLLIKKIGKARKWLVYRSSGHVEKQYRNEIIANRVYKSIEVTLEDYRRILKVYEQNMKSILRAAQSHGVDVLFLTLPANLRDFPPGLSLHHKKLSPEELEVWNTAWQKGQILQKAGKLPETISVFRAAAAIDPTYSELQFQLGQCLDKTGDYAAAKEAYLAAKDFDGHPWRSKTELNETLRRLASEKGAMLYDLERDFARLSSHGITSNELMYDNVHPTVQAQQLISDGIAKVLQENSKIAARDQWQWPAFEAAKRQDKDWEIDGALNAYQSVLTGLYLWEQKRFEAAAKDLEDAVQRMPKFIESYAFLADSYYRLGDTKKASAAFQTLAGKDPKLLDFLCEKYPDIKESYLKVSR